MTLTALTAVISLVIGFMIGASVTVMWEWDRFRKVHRRYRKAVTK